MNIPALAGCWSRRQVSDWIDFGGDAPCLWTDEVRGNKSPENSQIGRPGRQKAPLARGLARDLDGRYANSPLKQWFDSLRSGKGPCCSDADGSALADIDWESKGGHYRVRLAGEGVDGPDGAVITEPNRIGRTMVWPLRGYMGLTIRCFMPGSMT